MFRLTGRVLLSKQIWYPALTLEQETGEEVKLKYSKEVSFKVLPSIVWGIQIAVVADDVAVSYANDDGDDEESEL